MATTFTPEQDAAIASVGKTIVSASAGSGKTTVMIEKIIRLICSGVDVQDILAVTFTKKAASQMKEKLAKALIKAINSKDCAPENKARLKKQLGEVATANISTIHGFCSRLLKTNFYLAGVDNAFRVIGTDDAETTALKNQALDQLFDDGYQNQDEQFMHLLSTYWRKKSDKTLRRIFLSVYETLRNRADYKEYLRKSGEYDASTFDNVCAQLLTLLKEKCSYYLAYVEEEQAFFAVGENAPQVALASELHAALSAVLGCNDYFEACALQKPKFTSKRTSKKDSAEKLMHIERLAALKDKIVKIYDKELAVTHSQEEELAAFLQSAQTAAALSKYIALFDETYSALKTDFGVLDYNDLEHKTLELLSKESVASDLRAKYKYVFVDEYQDVNPVQEAIVSKISENNLFLVGDVKQSIYGFRGSQSKFFVEKQAEFAQGGGYNLKLTRNFRSSDAVLDAVNSQFSLAMNLNTSQVDYAADSFMERGGRYALNDGRVQLHHIPETEKTPVQARGVYSVKASASKKALEEENAQVQLIHDIIKRELQSTWFDADKGEYRKVRYSDIAILSRKKQGEITKTVAALAENGVPVTATSAVNICQFGEIKTLIDILSLLDNAEQDVPLCSALLSAMGKLSVDDLATIRLQYPHEKLFRNACKRYASEMENNNLLAEKLRAFYAYYAQLRALTAVLGAGEILTKLIVDTRMEAEYLSRENGNACLKRINRFIQESMGEIPLCVHEFLCKLKDMDYTIECMENGGEDSVKVMTMHASKGLEFPVVIVDNINAPFRGADKDEVLVEESIGLAPKAYDGVKMLKKDTLLRRLHETREQLSSIADELNLYYVALTRAQFALHVLYKEKSVMQDVRYAHSFADFTSFSVWDQYVVSFDTFNVPKQDRQALVFHPDEALARQIMQAFTWEYSHNGYENLPVKSSATQLMNADMGMANEQISVAAAQTKAETEAELSTLVKESTGVEAGLAYHAFLETFNFGLLFDEKGNRVTKEVLRAVIEDAYARCEKQVQANVCVDKLAEILSCDVFYQLQGKRLYKEQQFLVSLPVQDTYALTQAFGSLQGKEDDEQMLFQGAIDLLAVDENGAWIVDYKYSGRTEVSIREHYQKQLGVYRLAVAKILNIPQDKIRCTIVNIYKGYQIDV